MNLVIFAVILGTMAGSWDLLTAEVLGAADHSLFGFLAY